MVNCPRVLFNREPVLKMNKEDIFVQGDCDEIVTTLCSILGWKDDLIQQNERTKVIVNKKVTPRKVTESS
jgi:hypothetical protein